MARAQAGAAAAPAAAEERPPAAAGGEAGEAPAQPAEQRGGEPQRPGEHRAAVDQQRHREHRRPAAASRAAAVLVPAQQLRGSSRCRRPASRAARAGPLDATRRDSASATAVHSDEQRPARGRRRDRRRSAAPRRRRQPSASSQPRPAPTTQTGACVRPTPSRNQWWAPSGVSRTRPSTDREQRRITQQEAPEQHRRTQARAAREQHPAVGRHRRAWTSALTLGAPRSTAGDVVAARRCRAARATRARPSARPGRAAAITVRPSWRIGCCAPSIVTARARALREACSVCCAAAARCAGRGRAWRRWRARPGSRRGRCGRW